MRRTMLAALLTAAFLPAMTYGQKGKAKEKEKPTGFREPTVYGPLKLSVERADVRRTVGLENSAGTLKDVTNDHFVIEVQVVNSSKTRKYSFDTWRAYRANAPAARAHLTDNFGNTYGAIIMPTGLKPENSPGTSISFYPETTITELLLFETPVGKFTSLDLELPAANFGGANGDVQFRITSDDVIKSTEEAAPKVAAKPTTKPKPKPKPAEALELVATHTVTPRTVGTTTIPVAAGKGGWHVEAYEAGTEAERTKLVKDGEVFLFDAPTAVAVESTRAGWSYCRPTAGPHKGKFMTVREKVLSATK